MTPTILEAAASYIETHGHHKRWFWSRFGQDSPCCALGAMKRVAGEESSESKPVSHAAALAFEAYLRGVGITCGIGNWNDAPERTATEVIAALRAAAREGSK